MFFFSFMSGPLLWILKRQVLISFTILWLMSICSHLLSLNPLTSHCWQLSSRAVKFSRATIQSGAAYLFEGETYIVTILNKVNRFFVLFCYRAGSSKPSAKRQDFIKSLKKNTIKPWIDLLKLTVLKKGTVLFSSLCHSPCILSGQSTKDGPLW